MNTHPTDQPIMLRVSDVVHFDGCKRKWWLNHNWSNERFTPAFFIGTGIHKGLEGYYTHDRSAAAGMNYVEQWAVEQHATWDFVQTWEEVDGYGLIDEINQYIQHYAVYDREHYLDGEILEDDEGPIIERRLTAPILDRNGVPMTDSDGNGVFLTGQCDLGLDRNGSVYVVDHKSFSTRTMADKPEEGLEVDEQGTAYCYLFWRTYGVVPKGFIYNVFVKQHPQPPEVLKNGQLSIAKSQYTTAALYRAKVKELGLPMSQYINIIGHFEAQGYDRYFQRWQSSRNIYELQAFERRLAMKAEDIVRMAEDPDRWAYPSGSSYRCGGCPFIGPCKSMDDGGDGLAVLENSFARKELWKIES